MPELRVIIPEYRCWAQSGHGTRKYKILRARTAADAIAQAELLIRTQAQRNPAWMPDAGLTLIAVEPYEYDPRHSEPASSEQWL